MAKQLLALVADPLRQVTRPCGNDCSIEAIMLLVEQNCTLILGELSRMNAGFRADFHLAFRFNEILQLFHLSFSAPFTIRVDCLPKVRR
jgi:hypothetical protein